MNLIQTVYHAKVFSGDTQHLEGWDRLEQTDVNLCPVTGCLTATRTGGRSHLYSSLAERVCYKAQPCHLAAQCDIAAALPQHPHNHLEPTPAKDGTLQQLGPPAKSVPSPESKSKQTKHPIFASILNWAQSLLPNGSVFSPLIQVLFHSPFGLSSHSSQALFHLSSQPLLGSFGLLPALS